jgi:hypothetical protein
MGPNQSTNPSDGSVIATPFRLSTPWMDMSCNSQDLQPQSDDACSASIFAVPNWGFDNRTCWMPALPT